MLTIVLGYKGHSRVAEVVGLYNGTSAAAAAKAIAAAPKSIVRVEIFKNPMPYKRRTLVPRKVKIPKADFLDSKRREEE